MYTGMLHIADRHAASDLPAPAADIPAGWGATVVSYATNLLEALRCTTGTYGAAAPVYGPTGSRYACQKCPGFMTTQDTNPSLSQADQDAVVNNSTLSCVTTPGYGYNATSGWAYSCTIGNYSPGYTRAECLTCPQGEEAG